MRRRPDIRRSCTHMLNFFSHFWVQLPLSYALTVGGLVTGYRRGGTPPDAILTRALRAGLPVLLCVIAIWNVILGSVQTPAQRSSMVAVDLVLGIFFALSASALIGAILARRNPAIAHKRGTVLSDEADTPSAATAPDALTLAG